VLTSHDFLHEGFWQFARYEEVTGHDE